MRSGHLLLVILLAAAACSPPARAPQAPPDVMTVTSSLIGSPVDAIEVRVEAIPLGRHVLEINLAGPEGKVLMAAEVEQKTRQSSGSRGARPPVSVRVEGGSSGRVQPTLRIGGPSGGGGPVRNTRRVTAQIPLPEPEDYLAAPGDWILIVITQEVTGGRLVHRYPAPRL